MSEIYWITVLGSFSAASFIIAIVAFFAFILLSIACFIIIADGKESYCFKTVKKSAITSGITALIFGIFCCLIPSKQDLYLIYGAGTIVDYCQDNPKVKEIPDKAIDALNTWLDMVNKKKEDNYVDCKR